MKETCVNCGGWRGLHKWDTMQCPHNGEENNNWMDTHYQEEDNRIVELQAEVEALKKQVAALLDAVPSANKAE